MKGEGVIDDMAGDIAGEGTGITSEARKVYGVNIYVLKTCLTPTLATLAFGWGLFAGPEAVMLEEECGEEEGEGGGFGDELDDEAFGLT